MKLVAIRHTRVNVPSDICYGQTDVPLASTFDEESKAIKRELGGRIFDQVYCSPLTRCRRLAGFLCQDKPLVEDTRLMELNFGKWENRPWNQFSQTEEARLWFADWIHQPCSQGESYHDLLNRVSDFLSEMRDKHSDKKILVVTHGGIIRALDGIIRQTPPQQAFELQVDYGSIWQWKIECS